MRSLIDFVGRDAQFMSMQQQALQRAVHAEACRWQLATTLLCTSACLLRMYPVVQNYVGSQIAMFANGLAHRLGQHGYALPTDVYKESAREVFQLLISEPSPRRPLRQTPNMQLVFRHDCLYDRVLLPALAFAR